MLPDNAVCNPKPLLLPVVLKPKQNPKNALKYHEVDNNGALSQ